MPATSHRASFERWLRNFSGVSCQDVWDQRSEFGYEVHAWDLAFAAYKEGVSIERGRRKFLAMKRTGLGKEPSR